MRKHKQTRSSKERIAKTENQVQQEPMTSPHIGKRFAITRSPDQLANRVMAMQSLYGNSGTLQLLSPMSVSDSAIIQRKPPKNLEDAMGITQAASKAFPSTKPKQSNDVFSSLRIQAQEAFADLKSVADKVASQTGGKASYRDKLKGMDRSWDKIVNKYDSDASGLIDIIASKIVYDDFKGVYAAVEMLVNNSPIEIVYFADRFLSPVKSGYSDIIMSVKLPNGHIAEMRLHLASVDEIFEKEHRLYEIIRSKGYDALTEEQKEEYQKLKGEYDSARKAAFDSLGS